VERTVRSCPLYDMISYITSYLYHDIACDIIIIIICDFCRVHDCVVVLAPYPNNSNPVESFNVKTDFDLTGDGLVWYARPQLFFNCTSCPTGLKASVHSDSHKEVSLVYFSTLEPINLTPDSIMQRAGVPMLYDSASNPRQARLPCLY
jgi:hypothetical protein